jgi:hypothetical protein
MCLRWGELNDYINPLSRVFFRFSLGRRAESNPLSNKNLQSRRPAANLSLALFC